MVYKFEDGGIYAGEPGTVWALSPDGGATVTLGEARPVQFLAMGLLGNSGGPEGHEKRAGSLV